MERVGVPGQQKTNLNTPLTRGEAVQLSLKIMAVSHATFMISAAANASEKSERMDVYKEASDAAFALIRELLHGE